jgi:PAS domain S-box-containing protein
MRLSKAPVATVTATSMRTIGENRAVRSAAPQSPLRHRWQAIAAAAATFAVVFVFRLIDPNTGDGLTLLFVVPIVILASEFGLAGGLGAALVACGLVALWTVVQDPGLGVGGFLTRWATFLVIGVVVGAGAERLRRALRDRQELLDEVADRALHFDLSRDMLARATFEGYFDRVNDQWTKVLGWTREELTSRPYTDFVHPDDVGSTDEETAALAEGGVTVEFVNRYRTKAGGWRWLEWNAVSERERVYGAARDITERRVAENESRRLASIVEFSNDAIITVSLDARITTWNPAAERMSGYTADEAIGQPVSIIAPPDEPDAVPELLERIRAGEEIAHFEVRRRRKDGQEADLLVSISPVLNVDGEIEGASMIARDVTEQRRAEAEIERAKQEFFGSVSHELRTPLTSIIAYTELLQDFDSDNLSDEGRKALEVIDRNAQRELRLVGDMLLVTRIQEGGFSIQPGEVDLGLVVEDAIDAARRPAESAGLELRAEIDTGVPEMTGDPHRLGQAIDNLLSNAIKFTPGGGWIAVRLHRRGDMAIVDVEDSGLGIPEDEQKRLFDRLYRASSALQHQIQGIGIGLSIVKAIAEAHGGSVKVESEEGRGTTFTLEIPLTGAGAEADMTEAKEEAL